MLLVKSSVSVIGAIASFRSGFQFLLFEILQIISNLFLREGGVSLWQPQESCYFMLAKGAQKVGRRIWIERFAGSSLREESAYFTKENVRKAK